MLTAVSLMFPYLFGLGCFLVLLFPGLKDELSSYDDSNRLQFMACLIVLGIELNHSLLLLLANLQVSLLVGGILSVIGACYFLACNCKKSSPIITPAWFLIVITLYVASLFIVLIEPVHGWDARSIWFYHAKMIFYNASVDAGGDWALPSIVFSHPDYPKMIPILAAQIAFVAGYWNEYLPKLSLVALLLPAILYLISLLRGKWWHIFLIAAPLAFTHVWLRNG